MKYITKNELNEFISGLHQGLNRKPTKITFLGALVIIGILLTGILLTPIIILWLLILIIYTPFYWLSSKIKERRNGKTI